METFKDDAAFFQGTLRADVESLKREQDRASFASLFARLGRRVDAQSQGYYAERRWARTDHHEDPRCAFA